MRELPLPILQAESCEACGEAFTCGANSGNCWCAELELSEATRAMLRERYRRCLCRACLERFARAETATPMSHNEGGCVTRL